MSTKSLALTLVRPRVLELRQVFQDERLRAGQLLVQVEYSSVQPLDGEMFNCSGAFEALQTPHVMGVEGVGVVLKSCSDTVPEGARIAFLLRKFFNDDRHGAWQKRLVLDEERALILAVPPVVGLNQIAACTTSTVAALAFLKPFALGSQIIVTGACGAVGLAAMQLGALMGHKMVAFVRGPERASWLAKELSDCGSVAVVDTEAADWVKLGCFVCSKGESPDDDDDVVGGADGMLDGIGGEVLTLTAQHLLRVRAIIVRFGGEEQGDLFPQAVQRLRLQVMRETVESFMKTRDVVQRVEAAFASIGEARYRPKAWHVASWSEAAECLKDQPTWTRFQTQVKPGRIGRIILKFD
mmetsp:Transcript_16560/g.27437  ORF Transcript_16560/g.27437 Transcript_16560/m.27437 type:complete len:354 (-) Transcript_16560:56-1117(-)